MAQKDDLIIDDKFLPFYWLYSYSFRKSGLIIVMIIADYLSYILIYSRIGFNFSTAPVRSCSGSSSIGVRTVRYLTVPVALLGSLKLAIYNVQNCD